MELQNLDPGRLCSDEDYFRSIFVVGKSDDVMPVVNMLCRMDVNVTLLIEQLMTNTEGLADLVQIVSIVLFLEWFDMQQKCAHQIFKNNT